MGQNQGGKKQTANGKPAKAPVSPGNEEAISEGGFCSDSGAEYITGYTQDMYHTSPPGHHSGALSSLYRLLPSTTLSCGCGCAAFPHRPRDTPAARDTPLVSSGDLNVLFSPGWDKPAQPVTAPRAVNS